MWIVDTNIWSKDWAKQLAWLFSVTSSPKPSHNFISHENKVLSVTRHCPKFQVTSTEHQFYRTLVTCHCPKFTDHWLLNYVSSTTVTLPAATAADSETPFVPILPSQAVLYLRLNSLPLILQSRPSIVSWKSLQEWLPDAWQGSDLDSNLNSASWPTSCKGYFCSEISE